MAIIIVFALLIIGLYYYQYPRAGAWWINARRAWQEKRLALMTAYKEIGNISICYYDSAPGSQHKPILVLLHGFSSDRSVWLPMMESLCSHFRVLVPDLPGHGESEKIDPASFTTENMAALFWQWLNSITERPVHLAGHSVGGKIITQMTIDHPHRLLSLVLICPAGLRGQTPTKVERLIKEGKNPFVIRDSDDYASFYSLLMARPPKLLRVVKDAMAQQYMQNNEYIEALFNVIAPSGKPNIDALSQIQPATLLIWGAKDDVIHVHSLVEWQQGWSPDTQIFSDCGHTPLLEAPQRTAWAMLWFYRRHFGLSLS